MYEIWTSRNNLKYEKTQLPQETIIIKILIQLQNILTAHYKLHKLNDTSTLFQQLFCINNAIAKIAQRLTYECPTVKVIYRVTRAPPFTPDYSHQIH